MLQCLDQQVGGAIQYIVHWLEMVYNNSNIVTIEMVYRFEMAPQSGQRSILQYMVPWLHNVELLDHHRPLEDKVDSTNQVLQGSGWGSREGTQLVLHNLLYITAKVSGAHMMIM